MLYSEWIIIITNTENIFTFEFKLHTTQIFTKISMKMKPV